MMMKIRALIGVFIVLITSDLSAQDCASPTRVCFEEGSNIQEDSTSVPLAMPLDFGCFQAMNGTMFQVNSLAAGDVFIEASAIACSDPLDPLMGDSIVMVLFQSSVVPPCDDLDFTVIDCASSDDIFTVAGIAAAPDEVFYVFIGGNMDADDILPADCNYNMQISGSAVEPSPPFEFPDIYHEITSGESVDLVSSGADTYLWTPGGSLDFDTVAIPSATPANSTLYTLTAQIGDCSPIVREVYVEVIQSIAPYNVLTPNEDGKNDVWEILFINPTYPNADIRVYSRWGQQVFRSNGYADSQRWDGKSGGTLLPSGTYYYVIDLNLEGVEVDLVTGSVAIIY